MGDNSVQVNPLDLRLTYGPAVAKDLADTLGQLADPVTGISEHSHAAFGVLVPGTPPFLEGMNVLALVQRNLHDVQAFLEDVKAGTLAIQSAATTMAVVYATTDSDQANSLNAVDFAFAGEIGAPAGFPTTGVSTLAHEQLAAQEKAGHNTTAALAADDPTILQSATATTPVDGGFLYTFADGSRLQITSTVKDSPSITSSTKTVSIYRVNENTAATIRTTSELTDYSDQPTKTESTQTLTDSGQYLSSSVSTTHLANGKVLVTTVHTGPDGKPQTTTVEVTPAPPTTAATDLGEIEKYELQYHATGTTGVS